MVFDFLPIICLAVTEQKSRPHSSGLSSVE